MQHTRTRGFTLIELLVVIAIIGILSAVVLASLSTARNKGSDAAVKADLGAARVQAELIYDNFYCYSTAVCTATAPIAAGPASTHCDPATAAANTIFTDPKFGSQILAARAAGSGIASCMATVGGTAWAAAVQLKTSTAKAWCVDSSGVAREVSVASPYDQAAVNAKILAGAVCAAS